ncbi:MAG: hypothetical protein SGARI_006039 [Bacillariaceae sp.]
MVDLDAVSEELNDYKKAGIDTRPVYFKSVPTASPLNNSVFVGIPDCISESVVDTILSLESQLDNQTAVNDRSGYLEFSHEVHRVEKHLRQQHPSILHGLISIMLNVDAEMWDVLDQEKLRTNPEDVPDAPFAVYPEVEYISYPASPKKGFERHTDNGSRLTAVFMLTEQDAYKGGSLVFDYHPGLRLTKGACVIFRGEKLHHQVQPITEGRRIILQIELHGGHESEGGRDDDDDDDEWEYDTVFDDQEEDGEENNDEIKSAL